MVNGLFFVWAGGWGKEKRLNRKGAKDAEKRLGGFILGEKKEGERLCPSTATRINQRHPRPIYKSVHKSLAKRIGK